MQNGFAGRVQFFLVSLEVEERATDEDIRYLLADPDATVRASGFLAVARSERESAAGVLVEHVCDSAPIRYTAGGSDEELIPLGGFVFRLLEDPNVLGGGSSGPPRSLLTEEALFSLAWSIFARDECVPVRYEAGCAIAEWFEERPIPFTWESLSTATPSLDAIDRVKGLGRYLAHRNDLPTPAGMAPLRALVDRRELGPAVRLAAVSALVSLGDEHDLEALRAKRAEIDASSEPGIGARIVGDLERRLRLEDAIAPIVRGSRWLENEGLADRAIRAFEDIGPESFGLLVERGLLPYGSRDRDVRRVVASALERLVANARRGFASWELDSDLAYRLRAFAAFTLPWYTEDFEDSERLGRLLSEAPYVVMERKRLSNDRKN